MRYYAGIGSRETPNDILSLMTAIAEHLRDNDWVLRSGGAKGADSAFEIGANDKKEIFLPWPNFNGNQSLFDGKNFVYKKEHIILAKDFHPNFNNLNQAAKKFMIRNSAQIIGKSKEDTCSSFVICWTKNGKFSGGTGQALRIAESLNIRIYNLYFEGKVKH